MGPLADRPTALSHGLLGSLRRHRGPEQADSALNLRIVFEAMLKIYQMVIMDVNEGKIRWSGNFGLPLERGGLQTKTNLLRIT